MHTECFTFCFMKKSLTRKIGVAIVLIITSIALIIPSIAIILGIYKNITSPEQIQIDPSQITIETMNPVSVSSVSPSPIATEFPKVTQ